MFDSIAEQTFDKTKKNIKKILTNTKKFATIQSQGKTKLKKERKKYYD